MMPEPIDPSEVISLLQQSSDGLEDDTCKFSIYSAGNQASAIQAELETYWGTEHFKYSSSKTEFIWHSGNPPDLKSIVPSQLDGTLRYGISLQDEWFLVWCLFEISKTFDCQIQVHDNDGEFLLIEAADNLPKWLTPDLAKGRVWIQEGSLHLIPLAANPYVQAGLPTQVALEILRARSHSTVASASINTTILDRIRGASPQVLTESHLFNTEAYLHISIAKALQTDPNLIGLAVKAFCEKDADSFKACREMIRFPPLTPCNPSTDDNEVAKSLATNWPYCLIRMTRPLYAVLLNHETTFHPPKPFEKVGWMDVAREDSVEWKRRLVGMKISCGFEMSLSTVHSSRTTCDPMFNGRSRRYQSYLDKLQKAGYFQGEVEGSTKWVELESIAKKAYADSLKPNDIITRFDSAVGQSHLSDSHSTSLDCKGESDEWLDLNEEQLKALLKEGDPHSMPLGSSSIETQEQESDGEIKKMSSFATQMEKFVDGQGSLEGALHSDDEMTDDSADTSAEDSEQEELRADIFPSRRKNAKRAYKGPTRKSDGEYDDETKERLATLVPGLTDAEWGQSSEKTTQSYADPPLVNDSQPTNASDKINATTRNKKPLPKLTKQSYDGVCEEASEEDSDSDDSNTPSGMEKQVNAEVVEDIDMDEERDDFLKFAQEALGLTGAQYEAILDSRRERGAYVPPTSKVSQKESRPKKTPHTDLAPDTLMASKGANTRSSVSKGKQPERTVRFEADKPTDEDEHQPMSSSDDEDQMTEDKKGNVDLDTFDKLMNRMDEELRKKRGKRMGEKGGPIPADPLGPDLGGGSRSGMKDLSDDSDDSDVEMDDIDRAIHSELADLMNQSGVQLDGQSHDQPNYSVISNFLESFKSQVGLPGPVGNMAGRIGFDFFPSKDKKP
ncbi:hypothetical protein PtA15_7A257 [Puccinia triticina]|uniref:SGT1 protein n=1 Tax=Puccinia triticina TaxID=208348 RepID=A0ABY7CQX4_9BASI|nr:uncharacterized protein PtA15_7A257 [Puccinia triticina]WAQ86531.1 hypothetical protein PtA15_7A257 [Puccinia triticina]